MLSFGDPRPLAEPVLEAGVPLIVQVTDLSEAELALQVGADVLVAQGSGAGGHGGRRATFPFVPVVVDLAGPTPVLAAGGIADGRGLGAALVLGAAGAVLGTRFQASDEALVAPEVAQAIVDGRGEDTERHRTLDIARGSAWPERYTARTLTNAFLDRWRGRDAELAGDDEALTAYRTGAERGDPSRDGAHERCRELGQPGAGRRVEGSHGHPPNVGGGLSFRTPLAPRFCGLQPRGTHVLGGRGGT